MSISVIAVDDEGEWETLKALLPDFQGQRLLDLGCGYGWHCIYAMEHGAVSAVGVDISGKMLEVAREKTEDSRVRYVECAMEDIDFPDESFDVVLSSLAFHYVESFSQVVEPQPPDSMLHIPGMLDEMRRPMMLIVSARKRS